MYFNTKRLCTFDLLASLSKQPICSIHFFFSLPYQLPCLSLPGGDFPGRHSGRRRFEVSDWEEFDFQVGRREKSAAFCSNINFDIRLTVNLCEKEMRYMYGEIDKINTYAIVAVYTEERISAPTIWCISFLSPDEFFIDLLFERSGKKLELM